MQCPYVPCCWHTPQGAAGEPVCKPSPYCKSPLQATARYQSLLGGSVANEGDILMYRRNCGEDTDLASEDTDLAVTGVMTFQAPTSLDSL